MEKTYNPHSIEQRWYETWEKSDNFSPKGGDESFSIMIPPPNVTGSLHMGHGFNNTVMDTLTRYHRMKGHNTLWQPGTDHAGIATQMVVERQLNAEDKTRHDLGRDKFIERIWDWKEESGGNITRQLRRLGSSLDWSRERFTMDDGLSEAVQEVFVKLYEEGLIYRGKRLVNWDPVLHTAVSDLEVISEEESGSLWHMRYPLTDGSGHLVVATTRPETMLGDSAVAVHPDDERYQSMIDKTITLPLVGREIPIIADDYVDMEFGTGCVKITPAHDFNDYEMWQRHKNLDSIKSQPSNGLINIFTIDARIKNSSFDDFSFGHRAPHDESGTVLADSELAGPATIDMIPKKYHGLDRYVARKQIVKDLEILDLMDKIEPHKLMVPRGDRSGAVVEPFLTDQWYVKVEELAKPAIEAVETGKIKFVPDNWKNTYYEWMNNIQDWCISRQIWWGHRIPAWFDDEGNFYVGRNEAEVREKHKLGDINLLQDEDVLDTWFSSALWPFSTLGWPSKNDIDAETLKAFYPTSVLVTGFDIIFFWVARMIMMGLKFMGDVPFKEIYIHGLVKDSHGQKMSKSKGNVLDPIDLIDGIELEALVKKRTTGLMRPKDAPKIEKQTRKDFPDGIPAFGTDALRFTFASLASTGRDINFDLGRIEGYRNFCNKIWNAARYVLMHTEEQDCGQNGGKIKLTAADRWILSRLQETTQTVEDAIKNYRLDHMAQAIYDFTWNEYCDWYLELSKTVLFDDNASEEIKRGTRHTLVHVLETILRLAHPTMPYITEEIWQRIAPLAGINGESIMLQSYPEYKEAAFDQSSIYEVEWIKNFIIGIRQIRSGMDIKPGKPLPVLLQNGSTQDKVLFETHESYLMKLAKLESITWLNAGDDAPESATSLVGEMKLLIPMAGLIDKDVELKRLDKEIEKLTKLSKQLEGKLSNPGFTDKAPEAVVQKERGKLAELDAALKNLQQQKEKIEKL